MTNRELASMVSNVKGGVENSLQRYMEINQINSTIQNKSNILWRLGFLTKGIQSTSQYKKEPLQFTEARLSVCIGKGKEYDVYAVDRNGTLVNIRNAKGEEPEKGIEGMANVYALQDDFKEVFLNEKGHKRVYGKFDDVLEGLKGMKAIRQAGFTVRHKVVSLVAKNVVNIEGDDVYDTTIVINSSDVLCEHEFGNVEVNLNNFSKHSLKVLKKYGSNVKEVANGFVSRFYLTDDANNGTEYRSILGNRLYYTEDKSEQEEIKRALIEERYYISRESQIYDIGNFRAVKRCYKTSEITGEYNFMRPYVTGHSLLTYLDENTGKRAHLIGTIREHRTAASVYNAYPVKCINKVGHKIEINTPHTNKYITDTHHVVGLYSKDRKEYDRGVHDTVNLIMLPKKAHSLLHNSKNVCDCGGWVYSEGWGIMEDATVDILEGGIKYGKELRANKKGE